MSSDSTTTSVHAEIRPNKWTWAYLVVVAAAFVVAVSSAYYAFQRIAVPASDEEQIEQNVRELADVATWEDSFFRDRESRYDAMSQQLADLLAPGAAIRIRGMPEADMMWGQHELVPLILTLGSSYTGQQVSLKAVTVSLAPSRTVAEAKAEVTVRRRSPNGVESDTCTAQARLAKFGDKWRVTELVFYP